MTRHKDSLLVVLALGLSALVGYFDLHSDDAGIIAGFLVAGAFALGVLQPHAAWRWGLVVGLGVPVVHMLARVVGYELVYVGNQNDLSLWIMPVLFALAGAYAGVLVRQTVDSAFNYRQK